jgi:cytochrome c553
LSLLLLCSIGSAEPLPDASDGVGRSIYREGRTRSGEPVRATVQQGVVLSGADAACVQCHRRSGLGGSEGQNAIRPIAGRLLFSPTAASGAAPAREKAGGPQRPPYTPASFARALREGVDPSGRRLDPLMPRYALSDEDIAGLSAYLATLSTGDAPGVTPTEIHFATVIAPGVAPETRGALLDVLHAFFRDKRGDTRKEARRRELGREPMYRGFRRWVLHVWELEGAPDTWREQLAARYSEQPVFAVIGGVGNGSWRPVHDFCEDRALPCLFPDVDYPALDAPGYYSVYFSRGVALEAEVLAKALVQPPASEGPIVQVFREDALGPVPARALHAALQQRGVAVVDHAVPRGQSPDAVFWSALFRDVRPSVLILWLDDADLRQFAAAPVPPLPALYVSGSLSQSQGAALGEAWRGRTHVVRLFEPARNLHRHLARMQAWLRARGIRASDPRTQANAYFAATLAGEAISHLGENFSRDYFLEGVEQMTEVSLAASIYPHLSLGPGQRFASRGGYVLDLAGDGEAAVSLGDWLVP